MAVLDPNINVRDLYQNDGPHRVRVAGVEGVSTGDTLDLSARFSKVQVAAFLSMTSVSNGLPTIAGSTITFAQAGLNNDSGVLVVLGGWV